MKEADSSKAQARTAKARMASYVAEPMSLEQKKAKLKTITKEINKAAGRELIFRGGDKDDFGVVKRIPSKIYSIDKLTGGGLPRGRYTEIFGGEGVGKSTLALNFIAQAQQQDGIAVYIDAEHSFDRAWATTNGVDVSELIVVTPTTIEEALDIIIDLCMERVADVIVLDSVVALATVAEKGKALTAESIALLARKLSQWFRKSVSEVSRSETAIILVNQMRMKIGDTYGNPEIAPGGMAMRHYKSLSILMRKGSTGSDRAKSPFFQPLGNGKFEQLGFPMVFKIMKNKIGSTMGKGATPSSEATVDFWFGSGLDVRSDIVNAAIAHGIPTITKAGTWFTYSRTTGDDLKVQGKQTFIDALDDEDIAKIKSLLENGWPAPDVEGEVKEEVPID